MEVTVIVATYGDDQRYLELADRRAVPSVGVQAPTLRVHGDTLAQSRNCGAEQADTKWLVFLDADDELAPGYIDALATGSADLLAPAVRYCFGGGAPDEPVVFDDRKMSHLNPCVIGTAVRREQFLRVGGFFEEPVYEDWSLWLRCVRDGATLEHVPAAHYITHHNPDGRNAQTDDVRRRAYREIRRRYA